MKAECRPICSPTAVGVPLFGTSRHPTQLYLALAALLGYAALLWLDRRPVPPGALFIAYLGVQGLTLLLLEPLRADSLLLPYGIRAAQVVGLCFVLATLVWLRAQSAPGPASDERAASSISGSGG